MGQADKIRVLLADGDALRRDGLEAFLSSHPRFEVAGVAGDGETALREIETTRPQIALVDLNLPRIHGIEFVRRVRLGFPGVKVIVYAGSEDEEIVGELVQAGGDGYLLKNGPSRHLVDAILYVHDGGQYFSPQLRRDGSLRRLPEEQPRGEGLTEDEPVRGGAGNSGDGADRFARTRRGRRYAAPMNDLLSLRQRIRQDPAADLDEHDYEIMSRLADDIRPILDRLDEIDARVAQMELGDAPVPSDPRRWLNTQLEESLGRKDLPSTGLASTGLASTGLASTGLASKDLSPKDVPPKDLPGRGRGSYDTLEARLPELIEEAVARRFQQVSGKLRQEIEETHARALEGFVRSVQVKLIQRIAALESDMSKQVETMSQIRQDSQRTEENLNRLIVGVDKLARELPRRLAAAAAAETVPVPEVAVVPQQPAPKARAKSGARHDRIVRIIWATVPACVLAGVLAWAAFKLENTSADTGNPEAPATVSAEKVKAPPAPSGDAKTKMQAAQECVDRKDYAMAEDLYRQVVKSEPGNADALKALASVLYREDKIEESAEILDKLSKD